MINISEAPYSDLVVCAYARDTAPSQPTSVWIYVPCTACQLGVHATPQGCQLLISKFSIFKKNRTRIIAQLVEYRFRAGAWLACCASPGSLTTRAPSGDIGDGCCQSSIKIRQHRPKIQRRCITVCTFRHRTGLKYFSSFPPRTLDHPRAAANRNLGSALVPEFVPLDSYLAFRCPDKHNLKRQF